MEKNTNMYNYVSEEVAGIRKIISIIQQEDHMVTINLYESPSYQFDDKDSKLIATLTIPVFVFYHYLLTLDKHLIFQK